MTIGQYDNEYLPLPDRLTAYYRDVVTTHADDPVVGACLICRVSRCEDWRFASERLAYSDEGATTPIAVVPAQQRWNGAPT